MNNEYVLVSRWRVEGTCEEVADVLDNPLELTRWWPAVYLGVQQLQPPGADGTGRRVRLTTRGWLPYTIRWDLAVAESHRPFGLTIDAVGDFSGRGVWQFEQEGPCVNITYDWRIRAEKPLLKTLSPLLKPLFEANHRWAMARGEESLKLELARRRAASNDARLAIPPPPGPVTYSAALLLLGAAAIGVSFAYAIARARRS